MRSPNRLFLLLAFLLWLPFVSAAQSGPVADTSASSYTEPDENAEQPVAPDQEPASTDDDYSSSSRQHSRPEAMPRNTSAPTDEEWNSVTSGKDYPYKDEREYSPQEAKPVKASPRRETPAFFRAIASFFAFLSSTFGLIILFGIIAVVIGLVIYYMVGNSGGFARRNQSVKKALPEVLTEEDLLLSNWEEKMRAAMAAGDYRLAIRYGYLLMLQQLQRRDLILYRQDKTNTDYYRELADTRENIRPGFRSLTRAYEYAWYSGVASSQSAAEAYFNTYNALKAGLQ